MVDTDGDDRTFCLGRTAGRLCLDIPLRVDWIDDELADDVEYDKAAVHEGDGLFCGDLLSDNDLRFIDDPVWRVRAIRGGRNVCL